MGSVVVVVPSPKVGEEAGAEVVADESDALGRQLQIGALLGEHGYS